MSIYLIVSETEKPSKKEKDKKDTYGEKVLQLYK